MDLIDRFDALKVVVDKKIDPVEGIMRVPSKSKTGEYTVLKTDELVQLVYKALQIEPMEKNGLVFAARMVQDARER